MKASPEQILGWVRQFNQDGFLTIPNVLKDNHVRELREFIDSKMKKGGKGKKGRRCYIFKRLFEECDAALRLFDLEPVVSFAEQAINDPACRATEENFTTASLQCHVIHNNAIVVPPGGDGIATWHQDDPPHFIVKHGKVPENIHLPPLAFTVNYYLTDVRKVENGPTTAIKGSHLWGEACPPQLDHKKYKLTHALAPAGSAVIFNSQVWHRGWPNTSTSPRYVAQITYGRRIVGHKYAPFMNYQMPQHVVDEVSQDPRLKRLAGFLDHGAYG